MAKWQLIAGQWYIFEKQLILMSLNLDQFKFHLDFCISDGLLVIVGKSVRHLSTLESHLETMKRGLVVPRILIQVGHRYTHTHTHTVVHSWVVSTSDHVEDENLDDLISKDPKALERYLPSSSQDTHESFEGFKPDDRTRSESVVIRTYPDGVSGNNRVWVISGGRVRRWDGRVMLGH
jgi:hypothetical protein